MQYEHPRLSIIRGARVHPAPRVSVVIPAYRPRWLEEALQSVRAQTFGAYEILVVDDGSPEPISPAYADDLVLIRQENQGPGGARNTGVAHARGELLAFLDSDDVWLPRKLERQVAYHDAHPDCMLSFTDVQARDIDGGDVRPVRMRERYGCEPGRVPFQKLFHENCVVCSTAMVPRDAYLRTPGMDPHRRLGEDYGLWLRLGRLGEIGYLDRVLAERRLHGESLMAVSWHDGSWQDQERAVYDEFLAQVPELRAEPFVRAALARLERQRGYDHLSCERWMSARVAFRRALALEPTSVETWTLWFRAIVGLGPLQVARLLGRGGSVRGALPAG